MEHQHESTESAAIRTLARAMRILGSTWLGLALLGGIVAYLTVASVLPGEWLQDRLDVSATGTYGWWPHLLLWLALCVNIAAATVMRLPARLAYLGAWLAHAGVLLLAVGAGWYLAHRVEGDILVPRMGAQGFAPVSFFHDADARALYLTVMDTAGRHDSLAVPLPDLPRRRPSDELSVPLGVPLPDVEARVTGYRPNARVAFEWTDGGPAPLPAVELAVAFGPGLERTLVLPAGARETVGGLVDVAYEPRIPPEQVEQLAAPAPPTHELTVRVDGVAGEPRVLAAVPGAVFTLEEAGYRIGVDAVYPQWRMHNDPREPATPAMLLRVERLAGGPAGTQPADAPARFQRLVLAGREDLTTDFGPADQEMPPMGRRLDERLQTTYAFHDSPAVERDLVILTDLPDAGPTLLWVSPSGARGRFAAPLGEPVRVFGMAPPAGHADLPFEGLTLTRRRGLERAVPVGRLVGETPGPGEPLAPAVRVAIRGQGFAFDTWLPLQPESHLADPYLVECEGPGDGAAPGASRLLSLVFSRLRRDLPATLQVQRLTYQTYRASNVTQDYVTTVRILEPSAEPRVLDVHLNAPASVGDYRLSQQGWDMDDPEQPSFTRLGVATRPGIALVWIGCALIGVGFPYAFWVKPRLLRRPPPTPSAAAVQREEVAHA